MSGGDFDGDKYKIIYNSDIVNAIITPNYPACSKECETSPIKSPPKVTVSTSTSSTTSTSSFDGGQSMSVCHSSATDYIPSSEYDDFAPPPYGSIGEMPYYASTDSSSSSSCSVTPTASSRPSPFPFLGHMHAPSNGASNIRDEFAAEKVGPFTTSSNSNSRLSSSALTPEMNRIRVGANATVEGNGSTNATGADQSNPHRQRPGSAGGQSWLRHAVSDNNVSRPMEGTGGSLSSSRYTSPVRTSTSAICPATTGNRGRNVRTDLAVTDHSRSVSSDRRTFTRKVSDPPAFPGLGHGPVRSGNEINDPTLWEETGWEIIAGTLNYLISTTINTSRALTTI